MEGLFLFVRAYPALLNENGMPVNFRVYQAGMQTLAREVPLEQLRMSRAVRAAGAVADDFEKWVDEQLARAGVPVVPTSDEE